MFFNEFHCLKTFQNKILEMQCLNAHEYKACAINLSSSATCLSEDQKTYLRSKYGLKCSDHKYK